MLDENLPPRLKVALLRLNPAIDILRVGELDAPTFGTLDPEVLTYLEQSRRLLVTDNRTSMPAHIEEHWANGGHIWGLFWIRPKTPIGQLTQELLLVWETTEAQEWFDRLEWIPF